jgi:hypothetical protein
MSKRTAFSLVELLLALFMMGIVGAASLPLLFSFFSFYDLARDGASCTFRGEQILAALEPYALGAGLGMPSSREAFEEAFTSPPGLPGIPYRSWGAVSIFQTGQRLRLVSGIPLERGALQQTIIHREESSLELSAPLPEFGKRCPSYVFPASGIPFFNVRSSGKTLTLRSSRSETVHAFDEIHGVFAAEIYLGGTTLYLRLYSEGVPVVQPLASFVAGFHCEYQEESSLLSVFLLVRSSRKRSRSHPQEIPGWNFSWPSTYDPAYYHAAFSRSWRIRN